MNLVVADSGPLIVFARTHSLDVLLAVAKRILVAPAVREECLFDRTRPGAKAIEQAFERGELTLSGDPEMGHLFDNIPNLNAGEKSALALALSINEAVLIDEKLGRVIARQRNIKVIGSVGILLLAKKIGKLAAVKPILDTWKRAGYHLSEDLIIAALDQAGEITPAMHRR
ncbi:conserved hypothetical protein [Candidatus Accumulibacter aalborgensis]|uniref:DUF3368 domain-containing protein n=1 Tax=Candidatus Accumulibacter aalborgensis TaxID=1860102 RepID=A0A1A8XTP1_9PROT|nr:DUF3368 domain-containing protein [Candidatus Accumulibacter aalborgensis]SBT07303.1 conserved hypothetical protein [Candidatus Accumulibacter aalborgensis]